jgi:arginine deiminase
MDNRKVRLNVNSEIGKLEAVLLHRPGLELERLTPDLLETLLFDDIPWLRAMRKEHDEFADILRERGTEVFYVDEMLTEVLQDETVKGRFVDEMLFSSRIRNPRLKDSLYQSIAGRSATEVTQIAIAGFEKASVGNHHEDSLWDCVNRDYPFYINPVPNLYFMRDPAAVVGKGISINSMYTETRRRESGLIRWIYENHPVFDDQERISWYGDGQPHHIEGGDILVLARDVIAIGCSQRTSSEAIEVIARNLFQAREELREVLVIQIPPVRAFMHLDTVFTMVDYDKFTIYPGIEDAVKVYKLTRKGTDELAVSVEDNLLSTLKQSLGIPAVKLIQSGGGDAITAAREQWNDSTNTLAIAPGVVVTYSRNEHSNETLQKNGIEVVEIGGSELVRGRGGPRCMSCPLQRTDLK